MAALNEITTTKAAADWLARAQGDQSRWVRDSQDWWIRFTPAEIALLHAILEGAK